MRTLKGFILLTRPPNLLIALLSIFVGGFVTGTVQPLVKLLTACVSGVFIMAGANSINDFFDRDIDKINKPGRPLPAGLISPVQAHTYAVALFAAGIFLGYWIHWTGFAIAVMSSIFLYLYSAVLKRTVLLGNITVGLISGLAFVYGGLAVNRLGSALIVGIFAMFYHTGREIIKDIEDMKGDESEDARTLPVQYGIRAAMFWATGILIVLIGLTLIPYYLRIFNIYYLIAVIVGVDLFLIFVIIAMWKRPEPAFLGKLAVFMKVDMLMGLLAVYLGS